MLRWILGRSGFGKTHRVLTEIGALVDGCETTGCILLVPEQFSFETERTLIEMLGAERAGKVEVLSFTRMAERLLEHELSSRVMSSGAKVMLMSRALTQVSDALCLFGAQQKRADTATTLLATVSECRQASIHADLLRETAAALPEGTLRQKTEELSLILEAYDALVAASGSDPENLVSRLAQWLPESGYLRGKAVFVDGFKGFTAAEMQVLQVAMTQANALTVTLCTDRLHDETGGLDRFSVVMETARRLRRTAEQCGCAVEKPILLTTPYRFQAEELSVLEATAFTNEKLECTARDAVRLIACEDIYEEATVTAGTIRRLLREQKLRARRIAVVVRDLASYDGVLDVALEQAGIPYYLDRRQSIVSEGAVVAVLFALRIATAGMRSEWLLQLMKTGLLGFSVSSASRLENYVYIWNLTGSRFRREWQLHPQGFSAAFEKADQNRLLHLNCLRRRLIRPLEALEKALSHPLSGEQFSRAVYAYIRAARIDRMAAMHIRRLRASGEPALAERAEQVWNALMSLLDDMAYVFAEEVISGEQAVEMFRAAAVATDIGSIPQHLDAVQIGQADRMRFDEPAVVFLLGANEGVFPALPGGDSVLTDRERCTLIEAGLPLENNAAQHTATEQYLAYTALSAASNRLYVSYLNTLPDGDKGEKSAICHTLTAHLPHITACRARQEDGADIETAEDAFERMSSGFCAGTPLSKGLYELLSKEERYRGRLQAMTRAAQEQPITFEDAAAAARFFGDRMTLSATRVQLYHECRFAYFCQYGLKARALRPADLDALEYGTLIHEVMEKVLPVYAAEGFDSVTKTRCFDDAKAAADAYVEQKMGGKADKTGRFLYLLGRLYGVCGNFLWHAVRELRQSAFRPIDHELPIEPETQDPKAVRPLQMTLSDGTQIRMIGKIDRVDVYEANGKSFVRVIDYKTGTKKFSLPDVVDGLNLQLLIYMLTVWKNGTLRYGSVEPAGMLYMLSKPPVIEADVGTDEEKIERQQLKAMRMDGLLIDNEEVLEAMEPGLAGVFIPARRCANGKYDAHSSVATLAQFGAIGRRAQKLLEQMAATLRDGDVDALPYKDADHDPCKYCDYRAACGHEEEDRRREPRFEKAADVLQAYSEQEEAAKVE